MSIKGNLKLRTLIAVCAVALVASGCSLLPKEDVPLAPPLVKPVKQNFTTIEVKSGTIESTVRGVAVLDPYVVKYHQFKDNGGRVQEVFVKSGDLVKAGDPLIQLEVEGLDMDIKYKALDLEKAKMALEAAKQNFDEATMRIRLLELDIAQTNYDRTLEKLNGRQLTAEMDGVVTYVADVKPPDHVQPYQVLVNVSDTRKLRLAMSRSDSNWASAVQVGMPAEITWKGQTLVGTVTQTPNSAPTTEDQQLRERYGRTVYIDLEEIPEDAEIGNSMDVKIVTQKRENTVVIPVQALRTFMARNYVQILEGERIIEADVEIGIKTTTEVEILAGLEEGQQLILR